jgi:hypothetical protein
MSRIPARSKLRVLNGNARCAGIGENNSLSRFVALKNQGATSGLSASVRDLWRQQPEGFGLIML